MKITIVNTNADGGGASRAANRLHHALLDFGIDSHMRVLHGAMVDNRVKCGGWPYSIADKVMSKLHRRWIAQTQRGWHTDNSTIHTFGEIGGKLIDELNAGDADVLNLHWISTMLSIKDIGRLTKPIVWTLHDMWAFCGGEHYAPDESSARFRSGYRPDNRPKGEGGPDLNRRAWVAKRLAWSGKKFTIVSPSRWLADCARQSVIFADADVNVIPNPLNMEYTWRPIKREAARIALNLPSSKKLILMGADGGVADPRKGGDLLRAAISLVAAKQAGGIELMIYGQGKPERDDNWPCPVHWLGAVRDDRVLALAYSAADVMVVPSRQDNLPNTAVEAQACGTPVVAFDIGGLHDIVVHQETGWLAKAFDTADMAAGILWVLSDNGRHGKLSEDSRKMALVRFSPMAVARQYQKIYEKAASV